MNQPETNASARKFIELAIEIGALQLGEFKLKSGRMSPYFFNSNAFYISGQNMRALAQFYVDAIDHLAFDSLFGPAYKGIPLLGAVSVLLGERHRDCSLAYNRKEVKMHGEGGLSGGGPVKGRTLIIDDVITAGTAAREAITFIKNAHATPVGIAVCFDRCEKGRSGQSTIQELEAEFNLSVIRIATFHDLYAYAQSNPTVSGSLKALDVYREKWGV